MKQWHLKDLPKLQKLKLAVVGHVEWVTFSKVNKLPTAGVICHGNEILEEPAGGGAVTAIELARLTGDSVHLITSLGNDLYGKKSAQRLEELGLKLSVAWRETPTRRGISLVAPDGERAITVIGKRLQPSSTDLLPWRELANYDGVFITATDSASIQFCRQANVLVATPRVGLKVLRDSNVKLDALIGSGLDPDEKITSANCLPAHNLRIATEGAQGGEAWPGGRFKAFQLKSKPIDAYGCGDSFAAGVTAGLASGWSVEQSINLGAHCGAHCAARFGPYARRN